MLASEAQLEKLAGLFGHRPDLRTLCLNGAHDVNITQKTGLGCRGKLPVIESGANGALCERPRQLGSGPAAADDAALLHAAAAGWGWMSLVGAVIAVSWLLFFLGGGNAEKPRP